MCFLARAARTQGMACQWSGVAITTASRPGCPSRSRKSLYALTPLYSPDLARSAYRFPVISTALSSRSFTTSQTATTSTALSPRNPPRWPRPMVPTPMNPRAMRSDAAGAAGAGRARATGAAAAALRKERREGGRMVRPFALGEWDDLLAAAEGLAGRRHLVRGPRGAARPAARRREDRLVPAGRLLLHLLQGLFQERQVGVGRAGPVGQHVVDRP